MSFFFSVLFFSVFLQLERERERVYKIGYKEKQSQSLLIFFRWIPFFFYGLFFYPEFLALAPSATNPVQQVTFLLSISADGKESPLPFWGPSQSFGFSLIPSRVRQPEWGHQVQTSVGLRCGPHSFLTVILCQLATVNSNTRIVVILFLSSQWDTTWQLLKDELLNLKKNI